MACAWIGRAAVGAVLATLLAACGNQAPPGAVDPTIEQRQVPLDDTFDLEANERVAVKNADLRMSFLDVANDSRCPSDGECPDAGDAVVQLAVDTLDVQKTIELHTAGPRSRTVDGYRIELVELAPDPRSGQRIAHNDYELTLRVAATAPTE